jgi:hypothetical protein
MPTNDSSQQPPDFSLVLGGPLYQLYRRTGLSKDGLELLSRWMLAIALFTWLPLAFLSLLEGSAFGGASRFPFLHDIEAHVRFLIALPVLIGAELVVHRRVSPLMRRFVERRIVVTEDLPAFHAAIDRALRVRNSVAVEVAQLVLVYTLGLWIWRNQIALGSATWYGMPEGTGFHYTWAGYWFAFVSIPIFQFILLRWYVRIALWFWLLWRVSKLNLHLTAAHPDRTGGIGFLGGSAYAFAPIIFAQGTLLAGTIATRVLFEGRSLVSFKMDAGGFIVFFVLFILGPLTMFTPQLMRAKRKGSAEYATLANRYVFGFEEKWLRGGAPDLGELLGAADIQSLADLGNSYSVVKEMRIVPFGIHDITQLAAAAAMPLLPLTLTIFSLEELLTRLVKIVL